MKELDSIEKYRSLRLALLATREDKNTSYEFTISPWIFGWYVTIVAITTKGYENIDFPSFEFLGVAI